MSLRPWMTRRFLLALAATAVLVAVLVAASVRLVVSDNELSDDIAEDMVWLASQAQYEAVRFADALSAFRSGELGREDTLLRLDLLISRLGVLTSGDPRRQIETLGYSDQLALYREALDQTRERLTTLSPENTAAIANIRSTVIPLAQSMRDVANAALLARRDSDARLRDIRSRNLVEILGTLFATLLAGLLLAGVVVRDHREMVSAEAALERERHISKLHRAFISVVSHQFRTPIAIIDASAQRMIRRGALMDHEEVSTRAEKIRNACLRLTRLMESTINAARLEDGEIGFTPRACDLAELLRGVCESQAEQDQSRLELEIGALPRWVEADPTLLEQAVQNLVSNALKYSPSNSPVQIRAEKAGEEILIRVRDGGVGIPADEMGSLFQRFFRARTAEGVPGTGIGLSFVAQIMALHGGRVEVESAVAEGSTFTLRLPDRCPKLNPSPELEPAVQATS